MGSLTRKIRKNEEITSFFFYFDPTSIEIEVPLPGKNTAATLKFLSFTQAEEAINYALDKVKIIFIHLFQIFFGCRVSMLNGYVKKILAKS